MLCPPVALAARLPLDTPNLRLQTPPRPPTNRPILRAQTLADCGARASSKPTGGGLRKSSRSARRRRVKPSSTRPPADPIPCNSSAARAPLLAPERPPHARVRADPARPHVVGKRRERVKLILIQAELVLTVQTIDRRPIGCVRLPLQAGERLRPRHRRAIRADAARAAITDRPDTDRRHGTGRDLKPSKFAMSDAPRSLNRIGERNPRPRRYRARPMASNGNLPASHTHPRAARPARKARRRRMERRPRQSRLRLPAPSAATGLRTRKPIRHAMVVLEPPAAASPPGPAPPITAGAAPSTSPPPGCEHGSTATAPATAGKKPRRRASGGTSITSAATARHPRRCATWGANNAPHRTACSTTAAKRNREASSRQRPPLPQPDKAPRRLAP